MGKASRLKEQRRRERAERERAIRADPVLALATTLAARGWEDLGREPIMCPQGWWEFPPSLRRDEDHVREIIHPATVLIHEPSITVEFAGRGDINACAAHQTPAGRTFPLNHEGVATLTAALDEVEGHVVDGVEMLACADGRGGCGKDDPVLALRAALLERGWEEQGSSSLLWFEFPRSITDVTGVEEDVEDVVYPAHVYVDGTSVDENGLVVNLTITAHFAGIADGDACAQHQSPSPVTFPATMDGVAAAEMVLADLESHVVSAAALVTCATGPGGCSASLID